MTTIEQLNARGQGYLPGLIGIEFISLEPGLLSSRLAPAPRIARPQWLPARSDGYRPGRYDLRLRNNY